MLTQKSMSTLNLGDDTLQRFQANIQTPVEALLQTPIVDGTLVTGQTIPASGKLTVAHGLGRRANGVLVVGASAQVSLPYMVPADQTSPNGAVVLSFTGGAGATVSLWVF